MPGPADVSDHGKDGHGNGQDNDHGQGNGNGLGDQVSTWTHEGIHGTQLAALIHQLQHERDRDSPPPVPSGGPPPINSGGPPGSSGGKGTPPTITGTSPPITTTTGPSSSGQPDGSPDTAPVLASNQGATSATGNSGSAHEDAPTPSSSENGATGLAAAVSAAIFGQSDSESVFAPSSAALLGPQVVSASTAVLPGSMLALAVFSSSHSLTTSGASDVSLFPALKEAALQAQMPSAAVVTGPEGVQAMAVARAAGADELEAAPLAANQEQLELVMPPVANAANLGDGFRGFLQRMQDLLGRLAKSPSFVAIGSTLVAIGGVLFEIRRRRRRLRRLRAAIPTLAEPDSDLCLPESGGSSSVSPS